MQLELQPFGENDFDRLIGWIRTPEELHHWAGLIFNFPLTKDQLQKHVETSGSMRRQIYRAIEVESDEVIGHAELSHIWPGLSGRVSRMLIGDPNRRNQGFGAQIAKQVVEIGFSQFGFSRMDIGAIATNEAAIKCYRNAGFKSVGIWKDAMTIPEGTIDVHWLSIFCSDDRD